MKYILKIVSVICWFFLFMIGLAFVVAPFQYFLGNTQIDEFVSVLILSPLLMSFFYWIGPKQYKKYKIGKMEELASRRGSSIQKKSSNNPNISKNYNESQSADIQKTENKMSEARQGFLSKLAEGWRDAQREAGIEPKADRLARLEKEKSKRKVAAEKRRIQKEKSKRKVAAEKRRIQKEKADYLRSLSSEDVWVSYKKKKVCIDMHMELVVDLKGPKFEEKRNITKEKTILKYKFGRSKNARGNWKYDLEVTFENDRVTAFKDL